jgi:hypothetical protein
MGTVTPRTPQSWWDVISLGPANNSIFPRAANCDKGVMQGRKNTSYLPHQLRATQEFNP